MNLVKVNVLTVDGEDIKTQEIIEDHNVYENYDFKEALINMDSIFLIEDIDIESVKEKTCLVCFLNNIEIVLKGTKADLNKRMKRELKRKIKEELFIYTWKN